MRSKLIVIVAFSFLIQMVFFIPLTASAEEDIEWLDHMTVSGSCSTQNTRRHIQVNSTVVEIVVNLTWETDGTGANLDMLIEHSEGFVVNATQSETMPEIMRVAEFPNRGRWTLVVIPISCGSSGEAHFTANVTIRNIVLPELEVSEAELNQGDDVTFTLSSDYPNVTHYFFDYADGSDSGWIEEPTVSKEYEESGDFIPRARVRYANGLESDWVEVGEITVIGKEGGIDIILIAQIMVIILVIISILMYIILKKRKGI
jgi:hypothetical protein